MNEIIRFSDEYEKDLIWEYDCDVRSMAYHDNGSVMELRIGKDEKPHILIEFGDGAVTSFGHGIDGCYLGEVRHFRLRKNKDYGLYTNVNRPLGGEVIDYETDDEKESLIVKYDMHRCPWHLLSVLSYNLFKEGK